MCGSMADIQSATAEIRRGKKDTPKKPHGKNIMSTSATQGGHKKVAIFETRCVLMSVCLLLLLGHRLGDDLVDWNSGVSVRPSVRTSTKSFSDFHLIWCVGRP